MDYKARLMTYRRKNSKCCHTDSLIMTILLEHCTREKQRSVICFLHSAGVKAIDTHRKMKLQCGNVSLPLASKYMIGATNFKTRNFCTKVMMKLSRRYIPKEIFSWGIKALPKRW